MPSILSFRNRSAPTFAMRQNCISPARMGILRRDQPIDRDKFLPVGPSIRDVFQQHHPFTQAFQERVKAVAALHDDAAGEATDDLMIHVAVRVLVKVQLPYLLLRFLIAFMPLRLRRRRWSKLREIAQP